MGEAGKDALRVGFDRSIKLEFHGAKLSSDAGLFPYRDLDDAAQLTESGAADLFDFRTGGNIQHNMTALLRQSIYSRLAGYEDVNDAERLSVDPVMRHVVGGRARRQAGRVHQPGGPLRDRGVDLLREPRCFNEHAGPVGGSDSPSPPV